MNDSSRSSDDEERFAEWGRLHGPAVRAYLLAMVRRPELADELAQEVFFRAWKARHRYWEDGNARAYLLRIADRLACDFARKARREVHLSEEAWQNVQAAAAAVQPADCLARKEAIEQLHSALDRLTAEQRRVLLLRYYGGLSFSEIAAILACPLGTALSHCHRGLLALRSLLAETS